MRRRLQWLLRLVGGIAIAAGTHDVVCGADGVRGRRTANTDASVDSESRFFATWYTVVGALMIRAAKAPEREAGTLRLISAGWAIAALGRLLSIRAFGKPHPLYTGLMVLEFSFATLLSRWSSALDRERPPRSAASAACVGVDILK